MAHIEIKGDGLQDLMEQMTVFGNDIFEVAKRCVDAAQPIVTRSYRSSIKSVIKGPSTGNTGNSPNEQAAKKNAWGVFGVSRVQSASYNDFAWVPSRSSHGLRAGVLQYGRPSGWVYRKNGSRVYIHGLPPKPWLDSAVSGAQGPAEDMIEATWEAELMKYFPD